MVAQQIARGENQIVEIKLGARALVVAIALQDRTRFVDQRRQGVTSGGLHKRDPGVAAGGVVNPQRRRSADQRRPWRDRPASRRRPICPSCGRRRKLPVLMQRSGCGREIRSQTMPAGVAGAGPFAMAIAISVNRWTITAVSGSAAAAPSMKLANCGRSKAERCQMSVAKRRDGRSREHAAAAKILGDLIDERRRSGRDCEEPSRLGCRLGRQTGAHATSRRRFRER